MPKGWPKDTPRRIPIEPGKNYLSWDVVEGATPPRWLVVLKKVYAEWNPEKDANLPLGVSKAAANRAGFQIVSEP